MLLDKIVRTPRREVAGARTQKRFDYQKHWAICKILEIHPKEEDYLVLLEFHDDVAVLNHSTEPTQIEFYQIKTVEKKEIKPWQLGPLTTRKKLKSGVANSILGKLYSNRVLFTEAVSTCLISNADFDLNLKGGISSQGKLILKYEELDDKVQLALKDKLSNELGISSLTTADIKCLTFEVSKMNPALQEELTRNEISKFIEERFVGVNYQIGPVYKSFFAEISRVSNFDKAINDVRSLVDKKGLSKSMVNRIFQVITLSNNNSNLEQLRLNIESDLRIQSLDLGSILTLRQHWREFEVSFLQRDPLLEKINRKISQCLQEARASGTLGTKTIEARDSIVELYQKSPIIQSRFNLDVIRSIALYNLYAA
jgi:hypothetical protein